MLSMCMKGKKRKACCCLPLNVAGLGISVILIVINAATFVDQLNDLRRTEKKTANQIVSLIFGAMPLLCAALSIIGILAKKASLVGLAVTCIMPSIILVIVAIITLWIGICQDDTVPDSYTTIFGNIHIGGTNQKYVRGGLATGAAIIVIALLCYVGDIFKSIANMLARQQNPWVIGGKHKTAGSSESITV